MYSQKGNKSNTKYNETAEVRKTSSREDVTTAVILSVPPGVRIVKVIVRFRVIWRKVGAPRGRIRGKRKL